MCRDFFIAQLSIMQLFFYERIKHISISGAVKHQVINSYRFIIGAHAYCWIGYKRYAPRCKISQPCR